MVVAAPDHPFLMRSVDLLISGRTGLTAVMMSTVEERRQSKLFEARLTLNMMALPPHTTFVRVVVDDGEPTITADVFAGEFGERDAHSALLRLANTRLPFRRVDRARKAQKLSEERFADTYRLARVLRRGFKAEDDHQKGYRSGKTLRDRISNEVEATFYYETPTLGAVSHLTALEAHRWYGIIDGEVEPRPSAANALFVPNYPEVSGDPDKALRAAAFAGWVMAPTHSRRTFDDVGKLIERYTRLK
jgi:hypothetical protein